MVGRVASRGAGIFKGDAFLAAGVVSSDGLTVDFHGDVQGQATSESCLGVETAQAIDSFASDDCLGRPRKDASFSGRTFTFNCGPPSIPDPTIVVQRWSVSGTVRLR
jgi:hypothetical protein